MAYRIVVGIDFSEASNHALRKAFEVLGNTPEGELHPTTVVLDADPGRAENMERDSALMEDAWNRLQSFLAQFDERHEKPFERKVVSHVRLARSAAEALEQVSMDVDAHLVIVGTHGRRGLEKWVLGSVAEKLLSNGRVSMLVARPTNYEGMTKTDHIEPPRADEPRMHGPGSISSSEVRTFGRRSSHISGLL